MSRVDSTDPPEANPPVRRPGRPDPSGPGASLWQSARLAWRWLIRMRTALSLLAALAVLTLLATLVPQEPNVPVTVSEWLRGDAGPGRTVARAIDLVGGFDVYGSPLFLALLVLLFTSLTACLVPRYRAWWRLVRRSRPPRARRLDAQERVATFTTDAPPEAVLATARALLGSRRWRLRAAAADPGLPPQVAAERGHVLREGGSLVFHTSFYVLLVAVVAGQLTGFVGQVGVVEGERWADTPVGYWSYDPGRWWGDGDHRGFVLTLDRFDVDWHRDPAFGGQPRLFSSAVTVEEPDGDPYRDTVGGNDPLIVDGMKIHQLDWGYAPRVVVEVDGEVVHDAFVTLNLGDLGTWRGAVKAPAAEPDVGLDVVFWPYAPPGDDGAPVLTGAPWADAPLLFFTEYRGDLRLDAAQNVTRLDTTALVETEASGLRPGGEVTLADGVVVRFPELRRWVGFQVSRRPTVPLLLAAAVLVLLGLVPSLYAHRRRVWVAAAPDPADGRTVVTVAGRAFQRAETFADEHRRLARDLAARLEAAGPPAAVAADRSDDATEVVHR